MNLDLGILGNLAKALGIFDASGNPNQGWMADPERSLKRMLASPVQRAALIAFIDEALGGAERSSTGGVAWLPIVSIADPSLSIALTIDENPSDGLHVGIGLSFATVDPSSLTMLSVPLFRAHRDGGPSVAQPLLLGSVGGRIRIGTSVTIDAAPPQPGHPRLGGMGLEVDLPTAAGDPQQPVFGVSLTGLQLPGAAAPRDLRLRANGADELDDALLDLVLALVKAQADAALAPPVLRAAAGLLGLRGGDQVPDFPLAALRTRGVLAIADWVSAILADTPARHDWLGHFATFVGGTPTADGVGFSVGGAALLTLALRTDTGPSGNARLIPSLALALGDDDARVEARADVFCIDLVTGAAVALPSFGIWAAAGRAGHRILDIAAPTVARADTLRIGFASDAQRRLGFVLAADNVRLGTRDYATLDLRSPDAVMDAAGAAVDDIANELLARLGSALGLARQLLGLDAPAGVPAVTLAALMTDPVAAVAGYWQQLVAHDGAARTVLEALRSAVADASEAVAVVSGLGTLASPWRLPLIGPLAFEVAADGAQLHIGLVVATDVDDLGQRCTVVTTRLAAQIARIDLAARSAVLLGEVEASLTARERGVTPRRARLALGDAAAVVAEHVGLRLAWSPAAGLTANVSAPKLRLELDAIDVPVALPDVGVDGSVTLPAEAWDGIEALVGHLGMLTGGVVGDLARALGWAESASEAGGLAPSGARLRLADLVATPEAALREWLPRLAMSDRGEGALELIADLFGGVGAMRGVIAGSGRPRDPYRFALAEGLPNIALWFPPDGLEPVVTAAHRALRSWRPGRAGLSTASLGVALRSEAQVAADVRALVEGRDLAAGFSAIAQRWVGGDGRIVPPPTPPAGITIRRVAAGASQLFDELNLENLIGRAPETTIHVAIGSSAWDGVGAERRIDLSTAGLDAGMFALPTADTGDWYVALGKRSDCRIGSSTGDGTAEQAARLERVLDAFAAIGGGVVVVAIAGAGHAARRAAYAKGAVTDLVLLGTPLSPISLTAVSVQPTADMLRLLDRLLPTDAIDEDDDDLALGRSLVGALMELAPIADPAADLRPPIEPLPAPRAGLDVYALFGDVPAERVSSALTAIVAAGLAGRARDRARSNAGIAAPTALHAGLRWALPEDTSGTLRIRATAQLGLFSFDRDDGVDLAQALRVDLRIGDAIGWLAATHALELRAISVECSMPLDGASPGEARIVLHEARVFGQSWEALVVGLGEDDVPVLPEARVLLSVAVQRLTADIGSARSLALSNLFTALGLIGVNGGVVGDAVDQFVHDPAGFVRQGLAAARAPVEAAIASLLGPLAEGIDLAARRVHVHGGGATAGRFGWHADITASSSGLGGDLRFGPDGALPTSGSLQLQVGLAPLAVALTWQQSAARQIVVPLWPAPEGQGIARLLAQAAPSLAAHVALELMRRADEEARPLIDAMLDALGMLEGSASDGERALRPLAGLLADPSAWLRSAGSLASSPLKIQALLDALRPLMKRPGATGSPLPIASGVTLSVATEGAGARLALGVDPSLWAPAGGVRLTGGLRASLSLAATGAPRVALEAHLGLDVTDSGRQAVHARIGATGLELFLRPASGADVALVPFAGFGALSAVAAAALPFLLDKLAELPGPPGALVAKVGDALALRGSAPKQFSAEALRRWAADPVGALTAAIPSITATGLELIAPLLDDFLPAAVSASGTRNELTVAVAGAFTLQWQPGEGRVRLTVPVIPVSGIDRFSGTLAISAAGLDELSVALGPARIEAGGVLLQPFVSMGAGLAPAAGRQVMVGLSADATHHFAARWTLDSANFDLVASDGALATAIATTDPAAVALRVVEIVADVVAAVALAQRSVDELLDVSVGAQDVRFLLAGVLLDSGDPTELIDQPFDATRLLPRVHRLFTNIAGAGITIPAGPLKIGFTTLDGSIGLQLGLTDRFALVDADVSLWLENDDRWIDPNPPGDGGLFVGFLPTALPLAFKPSLVVNGLGLRVGRASGPLLDAGITLESIALHVFAAISSGGAPSGGVQLKFSNLAVSASGAGGENGIARGIMRDTGPTPPRPAFSPALAIQSHNGSAVRVSLTAGDGTGPWWIAIQRGFGPLYLEQIGFGTTMPQGRLERIALLMDGSVSMFGLTCAVDDLQITYLVGNNDFFNPASWAIDLAGLAVSANMAGVSIAGGLLKQQTPQGIEYLGMLLGRFAVYGVTVFGGYGEGQTEKGEKFVAFFAIGAINGPIGGPPAFFLTGIGGGFGINRLLKLPSSLSNFGDYPLIQALDIAAKPSHPMQQLRELGQYYPMRKGTFWFAAGISFNSFALVDGIAVVAVQIGDGLDINLLGLARMALPRPQAALVSIELALLVRFSSSEGVLWVQGQLTDNSWLLYPDIKLTGGFAFVIWFKGANAGEFVLTLGGFHPDFHRDGYPVVPRLGLRWSIGRTIVIKAGSYFALTSEALMTGGDFEASASFGPAWAEVRFGAHGIVFFDPFSYDVLAYARIAAGVTIDTWLFGEITISIHIGARIRVMGPDFRGSVTFEVGPIGLTFAFGGSGQEQKQPLAGDAFIAKYLGAADSGKARPHAVMIHTGTLPSKGENSTPDGSLQRPFIVVVEFSVTFTSTVPASRINRTLAPVAIASTSHAPSRALGVAPMDAAGVTPTITVTWRRDGIDRPYPFIDTLRPFGHFPAGIWGQPQDPNAPKMPKGEMIEALNELDLVCKATPSGGGPEIPYHQVEIGPRRPLPFTRRAAEIASQRNMAKTVSQLVTAPRTREAAFSAASRFLGERASPTALAALRGERQSPPRLGTLTEGLEAATATTVPEVAATMPSKVYDHFVDAPRTVALLSGATIGISVALKARTSVAGSQRAWRTAPPTLAAVEAQRSRSIATRLAVIDTPAVSTVARERSASHRRVGRSTLIAATQLPPTAVAHGATAMVARRGAPLAAALDEFSSAMLAPTRRSAEGGASLAAGQTAVLELPNARGDAGDGPRPVLAVSGAAARIVLLAHGGRWLADERVERGTIEIVRGTERIVAIGQGGGGPSPLGLAGWHAGMQLPYAGRSTALGADCVVHSVGERLLAHDQRLDAGWVNGAELARGTSTVTTTFTGVPRTVVIVLDDPAAAGDPVSARQLLLGLAGATRQHHADGSERAPTLLVSDNRSVLAYDVVADGDKPLVVTIATQSGWALVGVMASGSVDATGAVALIASRGLDAAMLPFASVDTKLPSAPSWLQWQAPARTGAERRLARVQAQGGAPLATLMSQQPRPKPAKNPLPPRSGGESKGQR